MKTFDFGKGTFLTRYIAHAKKLTDAYPEYHISCGLSLLSLICQRKLQINVIPQEHFTNLWFLNLGKSTVSRKSSAQKIAEKVLENAELTKLLHPEEFSREQLVAELAANPRNGLWIDEFGDFLASMKKEYQLGMSGLLCKMYDCPLHYQRSLRNKTFEINEAYPTILSSTTEVALASNANPVDLETGLYPRFLFVWSDYQKERKRISVIPPEVLIERKHIAEKLKGFFDSFYALEAPLQLRFEQKALDVLEDWSTKWENKIQNDPEYAAFGAFFGRIEESTRKIAALLQINGWTNKINRIKNTKNTKSSLKDYSLCNEPVFSVIRVLHVECAICLAEKIFIPNAKKVMDYIQFHATTEKIPKVLKWLKELGRKTKEGWVNRTSLLNFSGVYTSDFNKVIDTLIDLKKIERKVEKKFNERTNRVYQTNLYRLIKNTPV